MVGSYYDTLSAMRDALARQVTVISPFGEKLEGTFLRSDAGTFSTAFSPDDRRRKTFWLQDFIEKPEGVGDDTSLTFHRGIQPGDEFRFERMHVHDGRLEYIFRGRFAANTVEFVGPGEDRRYSMAIDNLSRLYF